MSKLSPACFIAGRPASCEYSGREMCSSVGTMSFAEPVPARVVEVLPARAQIPYLREAARVLVEFEPHDPVIESHPRRPLFRVMHLARA